MELIDILSVLNFCNILRFIQKLYDGKQNLLETLMWIFIIIFLDENLRNKFIIVRNILIEIIIMNTQLIIFTGFFGLIYYIITNLKNFEELKGLA